MHPFDWRTVVLAKHAQHVVLIHFPIALFMAGVAFDVAAWWTKRKAFEELAYYNLMIAALFSVPTILTGLLAWHWQLEGKRLKGVLLFHLLAALASTVMICVAWWAHYRARKKAHEPLPRWRIPWELLGVALVVLTGHLGGFLSGVNGAP
jgi:uncharacterized membrane protein